MNEIDGETTTLEESVDAAEVRWLEMWIAGPDMPRWDVVPPQLRDPAPDATLLDASGIPRRLSSFWQDRTLLLSFWRHYGCGCGVDRASRLREELGEYGEVGLDVVIIGQADPVRTAAYQREHGLDVPMLCDPTLEIYRAYGLVDATVSQVLFDAPESMWSHDRASGEAFMAARRESGRPLVDNPWMLPGEFVIDTDGTIQHAHRYQHCEDWPDHRVLLAAAKEAKRGS